MAMMDEDDANRDDDRDSRCDSDCDDRHSRLGTARDSSDMVARG